MNNPLKKVFGAVAAILILASCSNDEVPNRSNFLPENSFFVANFNSKTILGDAFWDLLGNNELFEGTSEGPVSKVLSNPLSAGVETLDKYYVFGSGSGLLDARAGMIFPLSDAEKFEQFLTQDGGAVQDVAESEIKVYRVGGSTSWYWDKYTAFYVNAKIANNLDEEVKVWLGQNDTVNFYSKNPVAQKAIEADNHINVWGDNAQIMNYFSKFTLLKFGVPLKYNKGDIADSYFSAAVNFNDGAIKVDYNGIMNEKQKELYLGMFKKPSLEKVIKVSAAEKPLAIASVSIPFEEAFKKVKSILDEKGIWSARDMENVEPLLKSLSGDIYVEFVGMDTIVRNIVTPEFDVETGEMVEVAQEVKSSIPIVNGSIQLKDTAYLDSVLKLYSPMLTEKNGVYSYANNIYFKLEKDLLKFSVGKGGQEIMEKVQDKLSAELKKKVTSTNVALIVDVDQLLGEFKGQLDVAEPLGVIASNHIDAIEMVSNGVKDGVSSNTYTLKFKSDDNGLVAAMKLMKDVEKEKELIEMLMLFGQEFQRKALTTFPLIQ